MLTSKQLKWINHLSNTSHVVIKPYDTSAPEKFEVVKKKIQLALGKKIKVFHCGATSLGISGQDEIDIYIPVAKNRFNQLLKPLSKLFGQAQSMYPLQRARFVTFVDKKHIDVFLINKSSSDWTDLIRFERHLKSHYKTLEKYRKLKEEGNGLTTREYYRRKIEFINSILEKTLK